MTKSWTASFLVNPALLCNRILSPLTRSISLLTRDTLPTLNFDPVSLAPADDDHDGGPTQREDAPPGTFSSSTTIR